MVEATSGQQKGKEYKHLLDISSPSLREGRGKSAEKHALVERVYIYIY